MDTGNNNAVQQAAPQPPAQIGVTFDCYSDYIRASRLSTTGEAEFTVDIYVLTTTLNQATTKNMTVHVTPIVRRSAIEGSVKAEPHQYMNKSYLTFSYSLNITLDERRKVLVAELLYKQNASFPVYLRSCGVGSFIISNLIEWGRQVAPNAELKPIKIDRPDPEDRSGKDRRINFFRKHGFDISSDLDTEKLGWALVKSMSQLKPGVNAAKIRQLGPITHEVTNIINETGELKQRVKSFRDAAEKMKKEMELQRDKKNLFLLALGVCVVILVVSWIF